MNGLRQKALSLLARREHSCAELARKLAPHGTTEEIAELLAQLQGSNLISDARYAEAYLRSHSGRFGTARLRQALRTKGLAAELIEAQMANAEIGDELARARTVWQKKFGAAPVDAREWARQARFLQARGFSSDTIRRVLRAPEES